MLLMTVPTRANFIRPITESVRLFSGNKLPVLAIYTFYAMSVYAIQ